MNTLLDKYNWRYATKKFDATQKINNDDLAFLKEAVRLSASSFGLQPYQVIDVTNAETRAKLQPVSWGQSQITEASHLFVFAIETNYGDAHIDRFIQNVSETRNTPIENLVGYGTFMKSKISTLAESDKNIWAAKQAYIALGNLLTAAAELKIDVTPMEGFEAEAYNEILGLESKGLHAVVVATIGYRHEEDATQHFPKVRKSTNELFVNL